jgi:nanoRNase/pAp phosphatase (c-di-AMP/oligoRNAs hydrolase)
MRVFGYIGGGHIEASGLRTTIEALAPDAIFDDMRKLPDLVSSLPEKKKAR